MMVERKTKIELFQASCCNPARAEQLTVMLAGLKKELPEELEIYIYNLSTGDEESWTALAALARYIREKGLNKFLPPGPSGIISTLPVVAINGSIEFLREEPTREQILSKIEPGHLPNS
ncbi:hypothetical protein SY88_14210 [Clostridiales bacterium PH28_bin88]|nr:hypothetical protein SY88_14210 [Clostridiales bacterium PH28_bin88]